MKSVGRYHIHKPYQFLIHWFLAANTVPDRVRKIKLRFFEKTIQNNN